MYLEVVENGADVDPVILRVLTQKSMNRCFAPRPIKGPKGVFYEVRLGHVPPDIHTFWKEADPQDILGIRLAPSSSLEPAETK